MDTKLAVGWDSIIGIASCYGVDSLGIESLWEQHFSHPSRVALRPTHPPVSGSWVSFQGWVKQPGCNDYLPIYCFISAFPLGICVLLWGRLYLTKLAVGMWQMIPAVDTEDESAELKCMCCSSAISETASVVECTAAMISILIFSLPTGSHVGQLFLYRRVLCREWCEKD